MSSMTKRSKILISVGIAGAILVVLLIWGLVRSNWSFPHLFSMLGNGHFSCMIAHEFEPATCRHGETCTVCGLESGEPAEHQWVEADCIQPKYCSVCELTEGTPDGHRAQFGYCVNCKQYVNTIPDVVDEITKEFTNIADYMKVVNENITLAYLASGSVSENIYLNSAMTYCKKIAASAGNVADLAAPYVDLSRVKNYMNTIVMLMEDAITYQSRGCIESAKDEFEEAIDEMLKLLGEK